MDRFPVTGKLSLSLVKLTHVRLLLTGLGTTTMTAHQSVGMSSLEMTPKFSIRSNSAFTLLIRGSATLRGIVNAKGVESGFNLILNSPFNSPSPLNYLG